MTLFVYADTSALAKRYWMESGTQLVLDIIAEADAVASVSLAYTELVSATCRAARRGDVPSEDVPRVLSSIQEEWESLVRIPVDDILIRDAADLVRKYPTRAYDAMHLAAALRWRSLLGTKVLFLAFDKVLTEAARGEGLDGPLA